MSKLEDLEWQGVGEWEALVREAERDRWLWFQNPVAKYEVYDLADVLPALAEIEARVQQECLWAMGLVSYEAAPAFDPALTVRNEHPSASVCFPLLAFGLYPAPQILSQQDLTQRMTAASPPLLNWQPNLSVEEFQAAIARIKHHIHAGDTYQVNYTFRLQAENVRDPWALWCQMIRAQPLGYGAFIHLPEWAVCSASPELFFSRKGNTLISKPMKGTTARGLWAAGDRQQAEDLYHSDKNRAENVMIVDMVRNDLARVARLGSVQVSHLFALERYPTVWQMTSTVQAETSASLPAIFQALFPPASITGAPKARTMSLIADLETAPRRVYTGTIGYICPDPQAYAQAHVQAQFNVAIRTVLVHRPTGQAEYGVGGGIVWDSTADSEFQECRTKAQVLTQVRPAFSLLESMLWTPEAGIAWGDRHLERLRASATYFGFTVDWDAVENAVQHCIATLLPQPHKLRLIVPPSQPPTVEAQAIAPLPSVYRVAIARTPIDSGNPFLYHKTTHRLVYMQARQAHPEADDTLLWNERGELTETCIANLVLELDGEWVTPPVHCGLLPGIYRSFLLEQGKIKERIVRLRDLSRCTRILLINAVRYQWNATLDSNSLRRLK
ncbi:aminodeoxychorismate synthase component I [Thermoleptolyngbya sp. C42_A2020_037]|uniref:aminodeoxychorismate synthase component I n=1 Tax=Thermoleptolyngbya sp. C42_A2020_037 TaxID=2747799 RepID=UPI0019E50029|nr:aminodeoxychorismate synthase component I [Thermoleptolyngbya sp. C42_A2020_037]MBF2085692.1 aminodeoxychorismate synthase component I [Thermoleptolyngbya sp. C42_A2020_037]